jgi:4-amino-4-deoxy-L-arabinose transferase-like glycosyltransferase
MSSLTEQNYLRRTDYLLLTAFCLALFGITLVGGRVLSMHEARLPETAREMLADHDWLVPKSGGRPWMERPPLPHWITVAVASLVGRCDQVWIVRLPSVLMATVAVLLLAGMMGRWFGRALGLLSGCVLATSLEFLTYAWLAEEEVYLAAAINGVLALFVGLQWPRRGPMVAELPAVSFAGWRPWRMLAFFVALGATNLIKGLFFAPAIITIVIGGFLLANRDRVQLRRYAWLWGWLAYLAVALAWPVAAYLRYPDVLEIMKFDAGGRVDGGAFRNPVWFYFTALPWEMAPWTLPAVAGLLWTRRSAWGERGSPERFLWCWALLPMVLLSIPAGKHHHYLVPALPAWAGLAALGAQRLWALVQGWSSPWKNPLLAPVLVGLPAAAAVWMLRAHIPGPAWAPVALMISLPLLALLAALVLTRKNGWIAAGGWIGILAAVYAVGHVYAGAYVDTHRLDTDFLLMARATVPADRPIYLIADRGVLEPFRQLFYLGGRARLLHNHTFLRDVRIADEEIYLIARLREGKALERYGTFEVVERSKRVARGLTPEDSWTLFRLHLRPDLERYSTAEVRISPAQAYGIRRGPFLGRR